MLYEDNIISLKTRFEYIHVNLNYTTTLFQVGEKKLFLK